MTDLNKNINNAVISAPLITREEVAELINSVKNVLSSVTKGTKSLSQLLNLPVKYYLAAGFTYVTINE